jgi:hypothetical protein
VDPLLPHLRHSLLPFHREIETVFMRGDREEQPDDPITKELTNHTNGSNDVPFSPPSVLFAAKGSFLRNLKCLYLHLVRLKRLKEALDQRGGSRNLHILYELKKVKSSDQASFNAFSERISAQKESKKDTEG